MSLAVGALRMFHVERAILKIFMPSLSNSEIANLLVPYVPHPPASLCVRLSVYLDLLLKWNSRTNLTAIRNPEEIVQRHFGESLFAGLHLGECTTLLDFGSGAGFPGLPIAILRPDVAVTLAESQNKKASFLREVIRTLGVSTEVWAARVETLPEARRFECVTLRAVDRMDSAVQTASEHAGREMLLLASGIPTLPGGFRYEEPIPVPNSGSRVLLRAVRV